MKKPARPVRKKIQDFSCFNEHEFEDDDWRYDYEKYVPRDTITLKELIEKCPYTNPELIEISCYFGDYDEVGLEIYIFQETEEEYSKRCKQYENDLSAYNKRKRDDVNSLKGEKEKQKKIAKLAKLKAEAERLEKEIS